MSEQISVNFPDGTTLVTMTVALDGGVIVERTSREGRLLVRATHTLNAERAQTVIRQLLIASVLPKPPGHEILCNIHDEPDPGFGETTSQSAWKTVRELVAETLTSGRRSRIGAGTYTPLTFLKWSLIFFAGLGGAFALVEFIGLESAGVSLVDDIVAVDPGDERSNHYRSGFLLGTMFLLLLVYGKIADWFTDTHRQDASPAGPALLATLPFVAGAHTIGGTGGLVQLGAVVILPLLLVAFGVGILNPTGMRDSDHGWFNWRGWY